MVNDGFTIYDLVIYDLRFVATTCDFTNSGCAGGFPPWGQG